MKITIVKGNESEEREIKEITPELVNTTCDVIILHDNKIRQVVKSEAKKQKITLDEAKMIVRKHFPSFNGKKQTINCCFHEDRNPSAILFPAGGFKCMSSNCKYPGEYMSANKFASLLLQRGKSLEDFTSVFPGAP